MAKSNLLKAVCTPSAMSTYRFTVGTVGRVFVGRHLTGLEVRDIKGESLKLAAKENKTFLGARFALMASRSLLDPVLSVDDIFRLEQEAPEYYREIVAAVEAHVLEGLERVAAALDKHNANWIKGRVNRVASGVGSLPRGRRR